MDWKKLFNFRYILISLYVLITALLLYCGSRAIDHIPELWDAVTGFFRWFRVVLHPLITGFALCYLLTPVVNFFEQRLAGFRTLLPRALRRRIAEKLRAQSQARTRRKSTRITDTNPAAIRTALHSARATILIHGHTHRPAVHRLDDGNTVYVLGDWRPHGEILRYADGACTLINSAEIIHAPDNAGA